MIGEVGLYAHILVEVVAKTDQEIAAMEVVLAIPQKYALAPLKLVLVKSHVATNVTNGSDITLTKFQVGFFKFVGKG